MCAADAVTTAVVYRIKNCCCDIRTNVSTCNSGGTGRSYNPELFCRDDRMVWVTGLTEVRRGRKMEEWGMDALEEVFGVRYNDFGSTLRRSDIGPTLPNICYFMPIYLFIGTVTQFHTRRDVMRGLSDARTAVGERIFAERQVLESVIELFDCRN